MRRFADWLFANPQGARSLWGVVAWWEIRSIPFNVIIGVYGAFCLGTVFWVIATSDHLQPGEEALEPIALLAAPFGNVL